MAGLVGDVGVRAGIVCDRMDFWVNGFIGLGADGLDVVGGYGTLLGDDSCLSEDWGAAKVAVGGKLSFHGARSAVWLS